MVVHNRGCAVLELVRKVHLDGLMHLSSARKARRSMESVEAYPDAEREESPGSFWHSDSQLCC